MHEKTGRSPSDLQISDKAALARLEGTVYVTRLEPGEREGNVLFVTNTPFTGPWRVILIAREREQLMQSSLLKSLTGLPE